MLSYVPFCQAKPATGKALPSPTGQMVFSAVVVFVHPRQHLVPIQEGVDLLLVIFHDPSTVPCSVLCHLPEKGIGELYPCMTHSTLLVLPIGVGKKGPILHLDTHAHPSCEFVVHGLHWWVHAFGLVVVLPPAFSPDVRLPNVYPIDELAMLWTNAKYMAPAPAGDANKLECSAVTLVTTSRLEANANLSQISLTDEEFIRFMTIEPASNNTNANDANNTNDANGNEKTPVKEAKKGTSKKTPKKDGTMSEAASLSSTDSLDSDAVVYSNDEQQPAKLSGGFPGWSNEEMEEDEQEAIANISDDLDLGDSGCHNSGIGMGSDSSKSKYVGIVGKDQMMVDMTTHYKATGSGVTMDQLKRLSDNIIKLTWELNWKIELTTLALLDKVKAGFTGTGSIAKEFMNDVSKLTTEFFMDAWVYKVQLDSGDTQVFHTAVEGLQERVAKLICHAGDLEVTYEHSKASFDTILKNMHQEVPNYAIKASWHYCDEYKCQTFDRIMEDHAYMDVTPFVANIVQNICTLKVLLTSHQLGWSVVPLQIMMAPVLMEAMPSHLEFIQYLTEQSLCVQRTAQGPSAHLVSQPQGVNLKSKEENPNSTKRKAGDDPGHSSQDSPMQPLAPPDEEPLTLSKLSGL